MNDNNNLDRAISNAVTPSNLNKHQPASKPAGTPKPSSPRPQGGAPKGPRGPRHAGPGSSSGPKGGKPRRSRGVGAPGTPPPRRPKAAGGPPISAKFAGPSRDSGGRGGKGGRPTMSGLMQSVAKKQPVKDAPTAQSANPPSLGNADAGTLYPASQFQERSHAVSSKDVKLRVIPMGGLQEVGMNCMAIEYGDDIIVIDVGWMFPDETMPGVDYVLPDVSYLEKNRHRIRGVIITHGHLDHIGGAPYLLPKLGFPPVYATQLAIGFMEGPLEEHGLLKRVDFKSVKYEDILQLGAFKVEFAHVNHSISEGMAVAVTTPVGTIFHSGDFKFDATPIADAPAEIDKLKAWGKRGILLAMCDSTNVERTGHTPSETEIGKNMAEHIAKARGRVILSTFSSSIPRLQESLYAAQRHNRKVTIVGRSMLKNIEICQRLGYIDIPKDILVDSRAIAKIPDNQLLIICTGSQANEMSALVRMAAGEHKQIQIKQGDTVILSSSPIPGNERAVQDMMDDLFRRGADVIYAKLFDIHTSGHAYQDELIEMLEMLRPQHFMPIHGPYRNRVLHGRLATSVGIDPANIHLLDDGKVLEATSSGTVGMTKEQVGGGMVFVDGLGVGDVGQVVLRDRKHMAQDGMFVVIVTVSRKDGKLVGSPDIISRGFIYIREAGDLLQQSRALVRRVMQPKKGGATKPPDWSYLKNRIRDELGELLYDKTQRRPMVLPVILEV